MNPTDLRTELSARAAESEGHEYGDLLPGVQKKIRRTKQRRVATALAGTAAVAAVAVGVLPTLTTTSTPDPTASTPAPTEFTRNDVTFAANDENGHPLRAAMVGDTGQTRVSFEWTPETNEATLQSVCSSATEANLRVSVNGVIVGGTGCAPGDTEPYASTGVTATDVLWTQVRPGTKTRVELAMVDLDGRPVRDPEAVIGAGFYTGRAPSGEPKGIPSQAVPTGPDDYVKDGIRYRAKVAGDSLVAAALADTGRAELTFEFTPTTARLSLRWFCLADPNQQLLVSINGGPGSGGTCGANATTDPGSAGGISGLPREGMANIKVGQVNTATVRLTDRQGHAVSMPGARIGLGIYQLGPQRIVDGDGDSVALEETKEYAGHLYRLDKVSTAAANEKSVQIATPAGVPFLVAYGSTDTGIPVTKVELAGIPDAPSLSGPNGAGLSMTALPPRPANHLSLRVTEGQPTKGKLVIATYVPSR